MTVIHELSGRAAELAKNPDELPGSHPDVRGDLADGHRPQRAETPGLAPRPGAARHRVVLSGRCPAGDVGWWPGHSTHEFSQPVRAAGQSRSCCHAVRGRRTHPVFQVSSQRALSEMDSVSGRQIRITRATAASAAVRRGQLPGGPGLHVLPLGRGERRGHAGCPAPGGTPRKPAPLQPAVSRWCSGTGPPRRPPVVRTAPGRRRA